MKVIKIIAIYLTIAFIFVFGFCRNSSKYPDLETDESGLMYKFVLKGSGNEKLKIGDYVEMELLYKNEKDSVLFNSKELRTPFRMQIKNLSHKGGCFENAMLLSSPGDKMIFVLSADSFYYKTQRIRLPKGVDKGSDLRFEMELVRKLSPDELKAENEKYIQQLKEQEDLIISNYIADNEITTEPRKSGLYLHIDKNGKGKKAQKGRILTVQYVGKFLDGRIFDSSYSRNEPFDFQLGEKQVIDAWEEACLTMREGDKVSLIVPSKLAYGREGYGNLIPPYSPLIFEIELFAVN